MKGLIIKIVFLLFVVPVFAISKVVVKGKVMDSSGKPVEAVSVFLDKTSYGKTTDEHGNFAFSALSGKYVLRASLLGYQPFIQEVNLDGKENVYHFHIRLSDYSQNIGEVVIREKSAVKKVNETAFNVSALDTRVYHNSDKSLSDALAKVSGVRLRETGGMGSDMSFSLNGFSGKHVKVFMDGIPMEGFGSSFQLNNIPVNQADRIEVYKGVVPVSFGADAMGGAVNIVTRQGRHNYLDASYSIGSFNTHKSYLNFSYTLPGGWTFLLNAYQNYSKNNYPVYIHLTDANGVYETKETKVNRFHDTYHNEAVIFRTGLRGKRYAHKLLFGITLGKNKADIQTGNNMDFVFGEKYTEGNTVMPTLDYEVKDLFLKKLDLRFNGNYNFGYTRNVDTARYRKYNWYGEWFPSHVKGESNYQFYKYRDHNGSFVWNLHYALNRHHIFTLNNVLTTFHRKGEDMLATNNDDNYPSLNTQNVSGLNYQYLHNEKWNTHFFAKHYYKKSRTHVSVDATGNYAPVERDISTAGYGMATTLSPFSGLNLKLSYEKAYRLPTSRELFGDNDLELGNDSLKVESSHNVNLNVAYSTLIRKNHSLSAELGLTYRDMYNFIRRKVNESSGTAASVNDGKVRNWGISADVRYAYKRMFDVNANITYQDIRNRDRYDGEKENLIFNDRIPNTPYFFGNLDASLLFERLGGNDNSLTIGYSLQFIEQFYLRWPSYGSRESKYVVPGQLSHDLNVSYQLAKGRYNIMLECRNLTDERLYDNYSLQKPGRSFSLKIRYYLPLK